MTCPSVRISFYQSDVLRGWAFWPLIGRGRPRLSEEICVDEGVIPVGQDHRLSREFCEDEVAKLKGAQFAAHVAPVRLPFAVTEFHRRRHHIRSAVRAACKDCTRETTQIARAEHSPKVVGQARSEVAAIALC